MEETLFPKGTLVYIVSAGPLYCRKGTIRAVERIGVEEEQVVFYLVALHDEPGKELWLEHDAVLAVVGNISAT